MTVQEAMMLPEEELNAQLQHVLDTEEELVPFMEIWNAYRENFGGFPAFYMMGMSDAEMGVEMLRALKSGSEIAVPNSDPGAPEDPDGPVCLY